LKHFQQDLEGGSLGLSDFLKNIVCVSRVSFLSASFLAQVTTQNDVRRVDILLGSNQKRESNEIQY